MPGMTPLRSPDAVPVEPMSSGAFSSSVIAAATTGCMTRSCGGGFSPLRSQSAGWLSASVRSSDFPSRQTSLAKRGVTRKPPLTNAAVEAIESGFTSEAPIAVVG